MKNILVIIHAFLFICVGSAQNNFSGKINSSDFIIEGKVVNQESIYNFNRTRIYTKNTVRISKLLKGTIVGSEVQIFTIGGIKEEFSYSACHSESLHIEQEGIYFIKEMGAKLRSELNGLSQNDFVLTGNFLTVNLTKDSKYPAFDQMMPYPSLKEIYNLIELETGKAPIAVHANSWDLTEIDNISLTKSRSNSILEYKYQEINYIFPKINIDVSVLSNLSDIYYAGGELLIRYDSGALGEYLVGESKLELTHGTLITEQDYSISVADLDFETLKVTVGVNSFSNLLPLSPLERNLFLIQIDISDLIGTGTIGMDSLEMSGISYYYTNDSKEIMPFDEIIVPKEIPIQTGCFNFFPDELNAGVGDVLTITSDDDLDFGDSKGSVWVGNANFDNTTIRLDDHHVTWSANEITILIPHITETGGNPGSGNIEVDFFDSNGNLQTVTSKNPLHICYSITNDVCFGEEDDELIDVYDQNGMGGYTFHLGSKLNNIPLAREIVKDAICTWADVAGINFILSDVVIPNTELIPLVTGNDQLNIIFLGGEDEGLTPDPVTGELGNAETFLSKMSFINKAA